MFMYLHILAYIYMQVGKAEALLRRAAAASSSCMSQSQLQLAPPDVSCYNAVIRALAARCVCVCLCVCACVCVCVCVCV